LRQHGRLEEANVIASKINELIVAYRSKAQDVLPEGRNANWSCIVAGGIAG